MTNLDDPWWPQEHDEIEAFLFIVDQVDPDITVGELKARWEERRDEMRSPSITCPQCGRTSHNPNDVREKYCGACNQYHDTMLLKDLKGGRSGVLPPARPV